MNTPTKTTFALAAAVALSLASVGFAESGGDSQNQSSQQSAQNNPQQQEQEFVKNASSGNNLEIQTGQFVADHSQDSQTKQLAQKLVQDHTKAEQQLKQAAQQAGVQVTDQLTPVHQAMLDQLEKKSGKELDRSFAFSAIADHHKDLLEYTYASQHLNNSALKQYASQCIPILKEHLSMADSLAKSVAGVQDVSTASER